MAEKWKSYGRTVFLKKLLLNERACESEPATANTISKMANGAADNLLLATYLSSRCQVFVAPSMDMDMLNHPSVKKNIQILMSYGNHVLEAPDGELASGLSGKGRMADPEEIIKELKSYFSKKKSR